MVHSIPAGMDLFTPVGMEWPVIRKYLQQVHLGKQQLWSDLQEDHPLSAALEKLIS